MNSLATTTVSTSGTPLGRDTETLARRRLAPPYTHTLVLNCPLGCCKELGPLVTDFILDGVHHVDLAGPEGGHVQQIIDALLVKGGISDAFFSSAWYPGETLESIVAFTRAFRDEKPSDIQVVQL
jgi:hypothetical protein